MNKNFIEITGSNLTFNFSGISEKFNLTFQRTLRIPDDNKKYSLPPSIGQFPLSHVDDYANNLPNLWKEHGGIFMPMYQAEAMWMRFSTSNERPFAIKIASGKINAVSGKSWSNQLEGSNALKSRLMEKYNKPQEPDYMVAPTQPWLDGFNVGKGVIRQFVAVPLSSGYTVEEQVTGKAEHGGIQIIVYPMKQEAWQKILDKREAERLELERRYSNAVSKSEFNWGEGDAVCCASASCESTPMFSASAAPMSKGISRSLKPDMGLGAGGMMTQEIYEDEFGMDVWDQENGLRVFVHLANSEQYKMITGKNPPTEPLNSQTYQRYGYPWFDYYSDSKAIAGSDILSKIDSIGSMQVKNNEQILPDDGHKPNINQPIIHLGKKTVSNGKW